MWPYTLAAARERLTDRILTNWMGFATADGQRQELHLGQDLVAYADSVDATTKIRDRVNEVFLASQKWNEGADVARAVEARDGLKPNARLLLEPIQLQPEIYGRCALCAKPESTTS
jgi:hypothetical protein